MLRKLAIFVSCLLASAAVAQDQPLKISNFSVEKPLKAGVPYLAQVRFKTEVKNVRILQACFKWSGEGPFCFDNFVVDAQRGILQQRLRTGNPNRYKLEVALRYRANGKELWSNILEKPIHVKK